MCILKTDLENIDVDVVRLETLQDWFYFEKHPD